MLGEGLGLRVGTVLKLHPGHVDRALMVRDHSQHEGDIRVGMAHALHHGFIHGRLVCRGGRASGLIGCGRHGGVPGVFAGGGRRADAARSHRSVRAVRVVGMRCPFGGVPRRAFRAIEGAVKTPIAADEQDERDGQPGRDALQRLLQLRQEVWLAGMRAATRHVFAVERHLPVCVALVVPDVDDMPFYEKGVPSLAWKFADPYSMPRNVSIDILTARPKFKPFEQAETYRAERVCVVTAKRDFLPRDVEVTADLVAELPNASPRLLAGAAKACLSVTLTDDEAAEAATYPLAMVAMVFRKGWAPSKSSRCSAACGNPISLMQRAPCPR